MWRAPGGLFFSRLSGCLTMCRARACAKVCFQNRGHAERSSVAGAGGDGTESKHPVAAPQTSRASVFHSTGSFTPRRPAAGAHADAAFRMTSDFVGNRISRLLSLLNALL